MLISVEIDPEKEYVESIKNNLFNSKHRFCKSNGSPMKTKIVRFKNGFKKPYDIVTIDIDTVICQYPMENSFKIVITKFLEALLKHIYDNNKRLSYRDFKNISSYLSIEYEFSNKYDYKSRNVLVPLLTDIFNYLLLDVDAFELLKKIPIVPVLMIQGTRRKNNEYCEELSNSILLSSENKYRSTPSVRSTVAFYQINVKDILLDLELFFEEKHYLICFMSELITYFLTNDTITMIEDNMNYLLLATSYRSERISKCLKDRELEVPPLYSTDTPSNNVSTSADSISFFTANFKRHTHFCNVSTPESKITITDNKTEKSSKHLYLMYKFIKIVIDSLGIGIQGVYLQKITCHSNSFALLQEPIFNFIYDGWSLFGEKVTPQPRSADVKIPLPENPPNGIYRRIMTIDTDEEITINQYAEKQYIFGALSWFWRCPIYEKKYTCNNFRYSKSFEKHNVSFCISNQMDKSAEKAHKKDMNLFYKQVNNQTWNRNRNRNSYFKKGH
eukprot:Pompholyxophrys_sp_v1_NODE_5_length_12280_cov_3.373988.p3 type:complete len:501 gc:universal NODE_5_length_12280_cov_3.373988:7573-6071(-)